MALNYATVMDSVRALPETARLETEKEMMLAMGYAWGYQDRAGKLDAGQVEQFKLARGQMTADFYALRRHGLPSVESQWREFTGAV